MKKRFLSFVLVGFLALHVLGQSKQKIEFAEFVLVTGDNVNLRKAPNTTSQKLFAVIDEGCYECINYVWAQGNGKIKTKVGWNEPCLATKGTVLRVVAEDGEWLRVYKDMNHCPYIMKKFTRPLKPKAITDELIKEIGWIHVVPSGKYKDYCWYFEEMNCMYFVGKVEGCRFVFTKFIEPSLKSAENVDGGFKIEQKPGYLPVVYYNENLKADDEFMTNMDLNKLSEEQFEKFLGAMDDCSESPKVTVFFDEFDQYGNRLSFYGM